MPDTKDRQIDLLDPRNSRTPSTRTLHHLAHKAHGIHHHLRTTLVAPARVHPIVRDKARILVPPVRGAGEELGKRLGAPPRDKLVVPAGAHEQPLALDVRIKDRPQPGLLLFGRRLDNSISTKEDPLGVVPSALRDKPRREVAAAEEAGAGGRPVVGGQLGEAGAVLHEELEVRAADDADAGGDAGLGEEGLPGRVAPERDAQADVLVEGGRRGLAGLEEEVAWQGVDEEAGVDHRARDDAEHVLGVKGIALVPGLVG